MGVCPLLTRHPIRQEEEGERTVSPRGKAIPALDEQLFAATEQVLARTGPAGLTSRAITDEAGYAKGVLHNHFGDLEGFLAAFVIDRAARLADAARLLMPLAGNGTVVDNLTEATVALFGPPALAISSLVISRRGVADRIRSDHANAAAVLSEIQVVIAEYLDSETSLGRIVAGTDTLAFTVFASAHQLFFNATGQPISRREMRQILVSLLAAVIVTAED
jgi:AcrR family transcriptional regulator